MSKKVTENLVWPQETVKEKPPWNPKVQRIAF